MLADVRDGVKMRRTRIEHIGRFTPDNRHCSARWHRTGTHAPQQTTRRVSLFDHLVGAGEKRRRNFEPKGLRRFEVDDCLAELAPASQQPCRPLECDQYSRPHGGIGHSDRWQARERLNGALAAPLRRRPALAQIHCLIQPQAVLRLPQDARQRRLADLNWLAPQVGAV